jgi:DNA-binding CsgD family transcriptional regulator
MNASTRTKRPAAAEAADAAGERSDALRRTMQVVDGCLDASNTFVGNGDDDVSPDTARSMTLLVARVREACDVLESRLNERHVTPGQPSPGPAGAPEGAGGAARLSPREREVARLLVDGYSHVNVAALCGVTTNTVRTLTRRLYRKLGVCNRADLVREILRVSR